MATSPTTTNSPKVDCEREVRFAVVMYGGVSLAINNVRERALRAFRE